MKNDNKKGDVAIFFTGGTICMRPAAEGRGVVPSGDFDRLFAEINMHIPGIGLRAEQWSDLPSPHMTPELMAGLARDVDRTLKDPSVLGAIVIHGTDVMVESAFMAELLMSSDKPVVFTGSMRFYSEAGYDGIRNLINSIKACLLPIPEDTGVALLMNDRLFAAWDVVKINSLNVDAFESPGSGPVGYIAGDHIVLTHIKPQRSAILAQKPFTSSEIEPNVALISCFIGMDGELIERVMELGYEGLVLEGFGAGNVPPGIVPAVEALIRKGTPVVLTTRCVDGGAWPVYGYLGGGADLQRRGVIVGGRLSGIKARLLLMAALGKSKKLDDVRMYFE